MGIGVNEVTDQSTKQGFSHPPVGTEPALGICAVVARGMIRSWTGMKHKEYWQSICTKGSLRAFLQNPLLKEFSPLKI